MLDHHCDERGEIRSRAPPQLVLGLGRISTETIDFGRSFERLVVIDVVLPLQADATKCLDEEIPNGILGSGCDDKVVSDFRLEHFPHRFDVITRIPPVSDRIQIAQV